MLIYIFAEHYPNPYKPQFDTEFAFLLRQGHEIKIFVSGRYLSTVHERVRRYGLDRKTCLLPTTLKSLPAFIVPIVTRILRALFESIRRMRDIFDHHRSWKENVMRAARMLMLPEQSPDLCYIHNIATAAKVDFLRQRYPLSRVILYFHGGEVGGVRRVDSDMRIFNDMDVVITNTVFSKQQAIKRGCQPERIFPLPVGFDLSDYPVNPRKIYRDGGLLRMISIGRLSEEKGYVYVLEALAGLVKDGHRELRYTIVGSGRQHQLLKDFVRIRAIEEYVNFVGELDKAGVVAQLGQHDVLILPSLITDTWAETQAAVVQEAMFMRLPVITTQAGGVPESIADVMRQFTVPIRDSVAIAKMIRAILALPEAEMTRLGDEGRRFTVDRFNIEVTGVQLMRYAVGAEETALPQSR